jgi:hypothetical protein
MNVIGRDPQLGLPTRHWRSDGTASLRLGEQVAIDILRCYANVYAEMF